MKITIRNLQKKVLINRAISLKIVKAVAKVLSNSSAVKKNGEITICIVSSNQIKQLNKKYLKKDRITDVLAFDLSEKHGRADKLLADIVISAEAAKSNSRIYNSSPFYELYLYAVHGALHLIGYDDATPEEFRKMDQKARHLLASLGINTNSGLPK